MKPSECCLQEVGVERNELLFKVEMQRFTFGGMLSVAACIGDSATDALRKAFLCSLGSRSVFMGQLMQTGLGENT